MEVYEVAIRGTKPLLMCKPTEFDLSDMPKRRRGEHLDPRTEAEMRLYKDDKGNIVIPAVNVKACIRDAGRNYKVKGRGRTTFAAMIRAAIDVQPPLIPLIHDGWTVDVRPVVIQGSGRILRARPRFDKWELRFKIINRDPTVIHEDMLRRILEDAGRYIGLCDFRPEFGTFEVVEFKKVES